ncbi:MAG TPA: phenylalanine--tRNA ligase subunit beta [Aquificales bacterium]|uniref:Phenylalanine--tRNA ligase subunit beta n=1 Tax=Aquifex aeolicus TaxID=63363 RepID=A0A9D1CFE7_AQUAO|nr:phenylalanine--tRNA ligase subunit beta [Aquificales bacterium]HIP98062.1 phenylalanine--tRNA ligase subunit beta [Aquifex aeolicus]
MRVPYSILNLYVDVSDIDPQELVEKLNTHSVEATLDYFGNSDVDKVVVGKIIETSPHPSLKKLLVCEVSVGNQTLKVCTNDKTVKEGDKVFVVLVGGKVGDLEITERNFKGVKSQGMFLGLEELIGLPYDGVFKFHDPQVEEGSELKKLLGLGEPIIELDITPNRGDLLSVKGLAREISALYRKELKVQQGTSFEVFGVPLQIEVLDKEACKRYRGAVVRNIKVEESPLWLQVNLWKLGQNPVNNVVDITNYILFTEGNPMHAFDLDKIEGKIYVKSAEGGERFKALNGKEYLLQKGDLVIADDKKILALAGIIGGENSAVSEDTTNILLETAYFEPFRVRKTAKRLDIRTESSYRFERNVDIENVSNAQNLALSLILKLAGGEVSSLKEVYPNPYKPQKVKLKYSKLTAYVGENIDPLRASEILNSLGLSTKVTLEVSDDQALKRAILKVASAQLGCREAQITSQGGGSGYILCDGRRIKYKLTEKGLELES